MPHAIQVLTATTKDSSATQPSPGPDDTPIPEAVPERFEQNVRPNFQTVLDEENGPNQESTARTVGGAGEGRPPEHVRGTYRFADAEDKTSVLDAVESDVARGAQWYVVRYHDCQHDTSTGVGTSPCYGWAEERVKGSPPSEVRT